MTNSSVTKLESLNFDCRVLIIDFLSIRDLLSLAKVSRDFLFLVEYELNRRFSKKILWIYGKADVWRDVLTADFILIDNELIAMEILQRFGHLIKNLKISNFVLHSGIDLIYNLIKENCYATLINLEITYIWTAFSLFQDIKKPFKRLKTLQMYRNFIDFGKSEYDLNSAFPQLQQLLMNDVIIENKKKLIVTLPKLKLLSVTPGHNQRSMFMKIFQKNLHILSFTVSHATPKFLKAIADAETNFIEFYFLSISMHDQPMYDFHFKNVKCFRIHIPNNFECVDNITFSEKLQEIEVGWDFARAPNFINFIKQNNHIKRLHVIGDQSITNNIMQELAVVQLNATQILLQCADDVTHENIIQFIGNNKQLKRLILGWSDVLSDNYETTIESKFNVTEAIVKLNESLEKQWKINIKLNIRFQSTQKSKMIFFKRIS